MIANCLATHAISEEDNHCLDVGQAGDIILNPYHCTVLVFSGLEGGKQLCVNFHSFEVTDKVFQHQKTENCQAALSSHYNDSTNTRELYSIAFT